MNMKKYIGLLFAMLVMVSCESVTDLSGTWENVRTSPFNRDGTVCK